MYTLKIIKDGDIFRANFFKDGKVVSVCCSHVYSETFCQFCARMEQAVKQKETEDSLKQIAIESKTFNEGDIVRFRTLRELKKLFPGEYRPPAFDEEILKKLEGKAFVVKSCKRKIFHYQSVELYNHPCKLSDLSEVPCFIKDCEIYSWMLEEWKNED